MERIIKYLGHIIYWLIVMIPFSIAIAPAPMNVFMGFLILCFLLKKLLMKEKVFVETAINIPCFFLFIITCLSIFNSLSYKDSIKGGIFRLLLYVLIIFIIVGEVKDKKHIKKVILSIISGAIFVALDGIFQGLIGRDFVRGYKPMIILGLVRVTASFKDPNTLGIYLSAIAPLIFSLTLYYLKKMQKIFFVFISIVVLAGIILTYSRPTLLAIYIALFLLGTVKKDKILGGFLILLILLLPFILPKPVKEWAREVDYNPIRFMCNDDRIAIYRNSLNMIKAHPLIGVGANTYMKNYKFFKESPEYRNVVTSDYLYAHNNFLHMAAEIGLIGLGVFIWLLYKLFKESARIYRGLDDRFFKTVSLSLSACLLAFLVNGLTESSMYSSRVAIIFWYLMGLSLALKKFIRLRAEGPGVNPDDECG